MMRGEVQNEPPPPQILASGRGRCRAAGDVAGRAGTSLSDADSHLKFPLSPFNGLAPRNCQIAASLTLSSSRFVPSACTHKSAPCKRGSVNVRFAPKATEVLRCDD